jgi:heat shock protein HtpX
MNYLRTAILLAALTALLMGIGYLLGGRGGAVTPGGGAAEFTVMHNTATVW